jgi:hypothetical protein
MSDFVKITTEQSGDVIVASNQRQKVVGISGAKVLKDRADAYAVALKPLLKELEEQGVTGHTAIAKAFSARNVPTARGGQWTVRGVTNLIGRLAVIKVAKGAV